VRIFIVAACVAQSVAVMAILNRIAYVVNKKISLTYNKRIVYAKPRRLFALFSTYLGFKFAGDYTNISELPQQYMIISNHQSLLDIPLFMRYLEPTRLRFVAKAELGRHIPAVSLVLRGDKHCLIRRTGSPSTAMRELDRFAERVRENNWIPVIFPEGTRSRDGNTGTFHAAGFRRFMDKYPLPVAVCAVEGGWNISSLAGMVKRMKGGEYRVKVLKVFPAPGNKAEQLRVLEEGKELINNQLVVWRSDCYQNC